MFKSCRTSLVFINKKIRNDNNVIGQIGKSMTCTILSNGATVFICSHNDQFNKQGALQDCILSAKRIYYSFEWIHGNSADIASWELQESIPFYKIKRHFQWCQIYSSPVHNHMATAMRTIHIHLQYVYPIFHLSSRGIQKK